jgi:hypothetical protein
MDFPGAQIEMRVEQRRDAAVGFCGVLDVEQDSV